MEKILNFNVNKTYLIFGIIVFILTILVIVALVAHNAVIDKLEDSNQNIHDLKTEIKELESKLQKETTAHHLVLSDYAKLKKEIESPKVENIDVQKNSKIIHTKSEPKTLHTSLIDDLSDEYDYLLYDDVKHKLDDKIKNKQFNAHEAKSSLLGLSDTTDAILQKCNSVYDFNSFDKFITFLDNLEYRIFEETGFSGMRPALVAVKYASVETVKIYPEIFDIDPEFVSTFNYVVSNLNKIESCEIRLFNEYDPIY